MIESMSWTFDDNSDFTCGMTDKDKQHHGVQDVCEGDSSGGRSAQTRLGYRRWQAQRGNVANGGCCADLNTPSACCAVLRCACCACCACCGVLCPTGFTLITSSFTYYCGDSITPLNLLLCQPITQLLRCAVLNHTVLQCSP